MLFPRPKHPETSYRIPDGVRVYAIGDIHGYHTALRKIHYQILRDFKAQSVNHAHIIYLGDYYDRGPDSAKTIDLLMEFSQISGQGLEFTHLKGNHDNIALSFLNGALHAGSVWLDEQTSPTATHRWEGKKTLADYGVIVPERRTEPLETIREKFRKAVQDRGHLDFLQHLELKKEVGDYLFVHAGVHPDFPLNEQDPRHLFSIREPFLSHEKPFGNKRIVHGHSESETPVVKHNRIGIDTGIYKYGVLTCAVLEGDNLRFLQAKP